MSHAFDLPTNLRYNNIEEVVETLGYPTSGKFLSNPFPLGGHSGFEFGFSTEYVNTTDLSQVGSGKNSDSTLQYNRFSVGKGLFYNIDVFLHFIPFANSSDITDYGGLIKWNFYQAQYLPFSLSVLGHTNTTNIQDSFINETLGWGFMGGLNLKNVALYLGGGRQSVRSTFAKNILDLNDSTLNSELDADGTYVTRDSRFHSFIGLQVSFSKIFIATQIDRYEQPVYSAKLGMRF